MRSKLLTAQQKIDNQAILIIDRVGVIGERLANELSRDFIVFLISNRPLSSINNKKIIHSSFKRGIPKIIKNNYLKIFIVDDGNDITRKSAFSFIENARSIKAEVYFLGSFRNIDLKYTDELIGVYDKVKVLIFGDLFDNQILFDKNSSVTRFISEIRKNNKIKVRGDGLALNYPISFDDTIKLIIKSIFIKVPKKSILLFSQYPITDISLANTFKKIEPDIDVDFINTHNTQKIFFPKNKEFALAKYDLIKKLSLIDFTLKTDEQINYKDADNKNNISFIKPVLFFLLACLFLLLLPLLSTYAYNSLGLYQLKSAKSAADQGDFEEALVKVNNAKTFFKFAKQTSGPFLYEADLIGITKKVEPIIKDINSGLSLATASENLLNGVILLQNLKSENNLKDSLNYFKNANAVLQELKAFNQFPKEMSKDFQNISPLVEIISNSSDVAPEILGFDKEKKYLVLLQNNLELRPSGGAIDAVGILKIKNGKVIEFKLIDAKELDKKLNVYISPPFFLRRYLPTNNYFLIDAGSNSDFITSAIDASNIYEIITKEEIDGVIGLNLNFLNRLLLLPNSSVNSTKFRDFDDNFLSFISNNPSSLNFDFYNRLLLNLSKNQREKVPYSLLSEVFMKASVEKEILFAFKDQNIQNVFTANNLSNTLTEKRKQDEATINDFFGISESNLSKNKVNIYIARSVNRELKIDENSELVANSKISFKNSSQDLSYKAYLQIILPIDSKLQKISVGGREVKLAPSVTDPDIYEKNNFKSPYGLEIEQIIQSDKIIFGFLINVPSQSVSMVSVSYLLPFRFKAEDNFKKYSLFTYKQPGIKSYPFEQKFKLPPGYKVLPTESVAMDIEKDEVFNFIISKEQ